MKMPYSNCNLSSIKLSSFLWETGSVSQMHEKFTTSDEAHDEKDFGFGLENIVHSDEERMICLHENFFLKLCALYLVIIKDNILSQ
jgi:hypothetical protein